MSGSPEWVQEIPSEEIDGQNDNMIVLWRQVEYAEKNRERLCRDPKRSKVFERTPELSYMGVPHRWHLERRPLDDMMPAFQAGYTDHVTSQEQVRCSGLVLGQKREV